MKKFALETVEFRDQIDTHDKKSALHLLGMLIFII